MKTIDKLTDRQVNVLRRGLILYRDKLEKLFSVEFMEKHKQLKYATLVLNDDGGEYFFTLIEDLNNYLCCPDYDPIDTEFMLQDLFANDIIRDEILVYMVDIDKPKCVSDYETLSCVNWVIGSAIMQDNVITSEEFERMVNIDNVNLDRMLIHVEKEGEK